MGETTPPKEPVRPYGPDCPACWAAGKSPTLIYVYFSGVTLCPGKSWPGGVDVNRQWILTRYLYPAIQCVWAYIDANWAIIYRAALAGGSGLAALDLANNRYFAEDRVATPCVKSFINATACGGINFGENGTGKVT